MIRILETRRLARWILAAGAVLAAACANKTAPPDVASPSNPVQKPAPLHPLDPLTSGEIESAVNALKAAGRLAEGMLFPILVLREPPKADVLARREGDPVRREAFAVVLDRKAKQTFEAVVDVKASSLLTWNEVKGVEPGVLIEEFDSPKAIVRTDPRFQAAMKRRGIEDLDGVQIDTWAAGLLAPEERVSGLRLLRCIFYYRGTSSTNPYFRPIEGVVATVDVANGRVVDFVDSGVVPWVKTSGDLDEKSVGPLREAPRPLRFVQPEGPSFEIHGHEVRWQKWRVRVGLHPREGAVLYDVRYDDRPVLYRASLSEMVVPYGDPAKDWVWRNAFDVGEYGVGRLANTLRAGLDAPENAVFLDATFADDFGKPYVQERALAVYERDGGILWKHFDFETGHDETRRARELAVEFVATIGNYDYALQWVFTQAGEIKLEAALTGILLPKGVDAAKSTGTLGTGAERFGRLVHPYVVAPNHQHFFNFRIDLDVDGSKNAFAILDNRPVAEKTENPSLNAFVLHETRPKTEKAARSHHDMASHRRWRVFNPEVTNELGHPTSYQLMPAMSSMPYLRPGSKVLERASFIEHDVWVTKYEPTEMNAAGYYVNQNDAAGGLPLWTADDAPIAGEDIVLWYTFGVTHNPRPEEWPVMPVHQTGFMLLPDGFFSKNPALDVPAERAPGK